MDSMDKSITTISVQNYLKLITKSHNNIIKTIKRNV